LIRNKKYLKQFLGSKRALANNIIINKKENNQSHYIFRTLRGFVIAFLLVLCGMGVAQHSESISIEVQPENSNFICYEPNQPKLTLQINNALSETAQSTLFYSVSDICGVELDRQQKKVTLLPGQSTTISIEPRIHRVGYYDIAMWIDSGRISSEKKSFSVVILSGDTKGIKSSRFGLYTLGSDNLIRSIAPKGYLAALDKSGTTWGTTDLRWRDVQPVSRNEWDWSVSDERFANLKKAGLRPLPHLFGTPEWASTYKSGMPAGGDGATFETYPPKKSSLEDWGQFVYRFVERYRDDLTYLRIWNEFDSLYWMGDVNDFAELLKVAYQQAHLAKPDIKIVIDTALAKTCQYEMLYRHGAGKYFDVISIHNYQLEKPLPPELTTFTQDYDAILSWRNERCPGCPVWDSEFCWLSERWSDNSGWLGHGELAQAQYLIRGHILGLSRGLEKMIWFPAYSWSRSENGKHYQHSGGLLRENMSPRPAYAVYQRMATLLDKAKFSRKLDLSSSSQYGFEFGMNSGFVTVLWSIDENSEWVTLRTSQKTLRKISMTGEESSVETEQGCFSLRLTASPVYIISDDRLEVDKGRWLLSDLAIQMTSKDDNPDDATVPITLDIKNKGTAPKVLHIRAEGMPVADSFPADLALPAGKSEQTACKLFIMSANSTGVSRAVLVVSDDAGNVHRLPISLLSSKAEKFVYRAQNGNTPCSFTRSLSKPEYIDSALITLPDSNAYQFKAEVLSDTNDWTVVLPESVYSNMVQIPIAKTITKIRITFDQMICNSGFEEFDSLIFKEKPEPETKARVIKKWETDREYINVKKGISNTGSYCVEIPGTGRSKTDPWSSVVQFLLTEKNRYYTISAYARMPLNSDISGWAQLSVVGSPIYLPDSFVVLQYMDDKWHRIYLTVKTDPNQELMRVCGSLVDRGLVYFDDIMAIPGKMPTDIPEIVSLDLVKKDMNGIWRIVKEEKQ
jgi:hypothetical protein